MAAKKTATKKQAPVKASTRKPKPEIQKAARTPSRKSAAPSEPHKVVTSESETPLRRALRAGDRILFTEGAEINRASVWFQCSGGVYEKTDGTKLSVQWLCLTPEAMQEADGDPLKAKYALLGVHQA